MKTLGYKQALKVSTLPTPSVALEGVLVILSSDGKPYWCDGSTWVDLTLGAASALDILDEGALQTSTPTSIDFVGSGVAVSHAGGAVVVTVPGGGSGLSYTAIKTSAYSAVSGDIVRLNSAGGAFTVSLPVTPADGTVIGVFDVAGQCANHPVLVSPLSGTVEGDAIGVSINVAGAYVLFVYNTALTNWKIADTYASGVTLPAAASAEISSFLLMGA